ncbi:MAG: hypothetical protein RBT45_05205 [Acholeplasmataceae bacterium]|nr:hypothetical protein [Acholeplasmataceae bacterium]
MSKLILKTIAHLEASYEVYDLERSVELVSLYNRMIETYIEKGDKQQANAWVLKGLKVFQNVQESVNYGLIPGLDMIQFNKRLSFYVGHKVFGGLYYYQVVLMKRADENRNIDRIIDMALGFFRQKEVLLKPKERQMLSELITLKIDHMDIDDSKVLELMIEKKKLFRNHKHLYDCYKFIADFHFRQMHEKKALENYEKMLVYFKTLKFTLKSPLESHIRALERLVQLYIHFNDIQKAVKTCHSMHQLMQNFHFNIIEDLDMLIIPYHLKLEIALKHKDEHMLKETLMTYKAMIEMYEVMSRKDEILIHELMSTYEYYQKLLRQMGGT